MADTDFVQFPSGSIALLNGDLMDVTDFKIGTKKNNKMQATLRRPRGAGKIHGTEETTVTFTAVISETGPERDWLTYIQNNKILRLRYKVPGETATVTGSADARDLEGALDAAVKYSITFTGRLDK
jgi:hypothetical protein